MGGNRRGEEAAVALFALGVVLLLPPVLLIFNRPVMLFGVPVLYLYLFVAWGVLIGLAAICVRGGEDPGRAADQAEASKPVRATTRDEAGRA